MTFKDYIKEEIEYNLNDGEYVENIAEDFSVPVEAIEKHVEELVETVAEAMNNDDYISQTINEWIADEIRNQLKNKLRKEDN